MNISVGVGVAAVDYKMEIIEDARKAEPLGTACTLQIRYPSRLTPRVPGHRIRLSSRRGKRPSGTVVEKGNATPVLMS